MRVEEESGQLLAELRRLRKQVEELNARVRQLESEDEPPPPTQEREGDFGPAVKRSASAHHFSAVNKALSMLGLIPDKQEQTEAAAQERRESKKRTASYERALERMRNLGKEPGEQAAPSPDVAEEAEEVRETPEEAEAGEVAEDGAAARATKAAEAQGFVPLPDVPAGADPDDGFLEADAPPVELGLAIAIDLERPAAGARAIDLFLLVLETVALAGIFVALPGVWGVVAALPLVALLAAPWWGWMRSTFAAHARFFSLILMARCLFTDVLFTPVAERWLNLRFMTMLAACLPAFTIVMLGRFGWGVQVLVMSGVLGVAVGIELGSYAAALSVTGIVVGAAITLRGARAVRRVHAAAAAPRAGP